MSNERPGCLGAILQVLGLLPKNLGNEEALPYAVRDDFLSPSELSFYKVLQQVVGTRALICLKVSLKDLFFVKASDRSKHSSYSNKIDRKHVDFLLCSIDTVKPICGIELDDTSHKREDRVARDAFVNRVFDTAGVTLVRFENRRRYTLAEIDSKVGPVLSTGGQSNTKVVGAKDEAAAAIDYGNSDDIPICKKCGVPMIIREAKKGESKGQAFYGCPNFPKCREVVQVRD